VSTFTDSQGWYPGLELRNGGLWIRDIDASVVIPSVGNARYSVRITDINGNPLPALYGINTSVGVLGSGNPGDAGVAYGVSIVILKAAGDNTYATVHVVPVGS
jgi:immune inhibitor A